MRRFAVIGAVRVTGEDTARVVHCLTEEEARYLANENGIVVNRVVEFDPELPCAASTTSISGIPKWVGIIAILVAAVISVPHWLELIHWRKATAPVLEATTSWITTDRNAKELAPEIAVYAIGENRAIVVVQYPQVNPLLSGKRTKFYVVDLTAGMAQELLFGINPP